MVIQGDKVLRLLFSRATGLFSLSSLITYSVIYFFLVTITSGISVASGLFVPMMTFGNLHVTKKNMIEI